MCTVSKNFYGDYFSTISSIVFIASKILLIENLQHYVERTTILYNVRSTLYVFYVATNDPTREERQNIQKEEKKV